MSLHGRIFIPQNAVELSEAIYYAFDYRGDVTLHFKDGLEVTGYLYRYDLTRDQVFLFVETEPKHSISKCFTASEIVTISFTGEDHAQSQSGGLWEEY